MFLKVPILTGEIGMESEDQGHGKSIGETIECWHNVMLGTKPDLVGW